MLKHRRTISFVFRFLLILSISGLVSACGADDRSAAEITSVKPSDGDITVGMTLSEFRAVFPEAEVRSGGQWSRKDTIHGLHGEWLYSFAGERLAWFVFNAYEPVVSDETFLSCLQATRRMIDDFTERYGAPAHRVTGIEEYQDPSIRPHLGYNVVEARWKGSEGLMKVQFYFQGQSEQYRFLVTVEGRT